MKKNSTKRILKCGLDSRLRKMKCKKEMVRGSCVEKRMGSILTI